MKSVIWYIILILCLAVLLFICLLFRQKQRRHRRAAVPKEVVLPSQPEPVEIELVSPISGKLIEPSDSARAIPSPVRKGCAIAPSEGKVYAPCDCTVVSVGEGSRSLGLHADSGIELTVRIGSGALPPPNAHFSSCCKAGDSVRTGDLLLSFELEALEADGLDTTAFIWVEKPALFTSITVTDVRKVSVGDALIEILV